MSTSPPTNLEEAIRQSGEDWLIDWFAPPSDAMNHIRQVLEEIDRRAKARLLGNAPVLTESSILAEYERNPQRVKGFFQALGTSCTPDILLMAWRIIQGMEIKSIEFTYFRQQSFELRMVLESSYGGEEELYISSNINDFKILRHIGIFEVGVSPVFEGFYALNLRR